MDEFYQEMFDTLSRSRNATTTRSKAASVQTTEEMVTMSMKDFRLLLAQDGLCANTIEQTIRKSKAASVCASGINQAQVINDFLS